MGSATLLDSTDPNNESAPVATPSDSSISGKSFFNFFNIGSVCHWSKLFLFYLFILCLSLLTAKFLGYDNWVFSDLCLFGFRFFFFFFFFTNA